MKVLAIGDVHQKSWIIDKVATIIKNYDKVVFVGDYVDNWTSSPIDRVTILLKIMAMKEDYGDKVTFLMGNHDLCYVDKRYAGLYGGWDSTANMLIGLSDELKEFLPRLPHTEEIDGVMYSHAGIVDGWNEDTEPIGEYGHMWVRPSDGFLYRPYQVFGHTPQETCTEVQYKAWCIDTFSQHRDMTKIGDETVLEITDGKDFKVVKL